MLSGTDNSGSEWGTRFFLHYSGGTPTGADCTTLANQIEAAYAAHIAALVVPGTALKEVDVLDIASDRGLSGQWSGSTAGTEAGAALPAQVALNVEYGIARRYRGGKPRGYWPMGSETDLLNASDWGPAFITSSQNAVIAFFNQLEAYAGIPANPFRHVNLSYYSGFKNVTNSSGRERAVPQYRPQALHDDITGYFSKVVLGSQRRRRTATSP